MDSLSVISSLAVLVITSHDREFVRYVRGAADYGLHCSHTSRLVSLDALPSEHAGSQHRQCYRTDRDLLVIRGIVYILGIVG